MQPRQSQTAVNSSIDDNRGAHNPSCEQRQRRPQCSSRHPRRNPHHAPSPTETATQMDYDYAIRSKPRVADARAPPPRARRANNHRPRISASRPAPRSGRASYHATRTRESRLSPTDPRSPSPKDTLSSFSGGDYSSPQPSYNNTATTTVSSPRVPPPLPSRHRALPHSGSPYTSA